jgi:hypothetical protein
MKLRKSVPSIQIVGLALAVFLFAGCGKNIQTPEAVRQAVQDDVKARAAQTGLNVDAMEVSVSSVSFEKDVAHANVMFTVKSAGGGGMQMQYDLARSGDVWKVTGRKAAGMEMPGAGPGGAPTGAAPGQMTPQALPPGHPATDGNAAPAGALPPGHPPTANSPAGNSK